MLYYRVTQLNGLRYLLITLPILIGVGSLVLLSRLLSYQTAISPSLIAQLFLLNIIKYTPQLLILSVTISVLLTIRQFFHKNEMQAWFSVGIGLPHFILPVLSFVLPVAIVVGLFSLSWSAWSAHQIKTLSNQAILHWDINRFTPNQFNQILGDDYTLFLNDNTQNIFIANNNNQISLIVFTQQLDNTDNHIIKLTNGALFYLEKTNNISTINKIFFDSMRLSSPLQKPQKFSARTKPFTKLNWSVPEERGELSWRLSLPLAVIVLGILAMLLGQPYQHQKGIRYGPLIMIVSVFLYLNLLRYIKAQVVNENLTFNLALLLPPLVMALLSAFLTYRFCR